MDTADTSTADASTADPATAELRNEVAQLRAELEQVRAENDASRSTRRGVLRLAGAAAVGVVAAAVGGAHQAAATTAETMQVGYFHPTQHTTTLSYGTAAKSAGAAIANQSTPMLRVETNFSDSTGISVAGSFLGIASDGTEAGYIGYNGRYNYIAGASEKAAIQLRAVNSVTLLPKTPPPSRGDDHVRGELDTDNNGDLWWCTTDGNPGKWKKVSGTNVAGSFHVISPTRVYDSRAALPTPGVLAGGASRVVSIKDARPDATGAVSTADIVPAGAAAIAYNLTISDTAGAGYLSVTEGDAAGFTASSINWSGSGQLLANGLVVKLDGNRQVKVFAGGGSTNFIIDVLGYYL
ncbi:MAG: hypothetical protein RLZZ623_2966 [Actinomycetota bacterium]